MQLVESDMHALMPCDKYVHMNYRISLSPCTTDNV